MVVKFLAAVVQMAEASRAAHDTTVASSAGDFFCDLCKLEFSTKEVNLTILKLK